MRRGWNSSVLLGLTLVAACVPPLSDEDAALIDAVALVLFNVEEGGVIDSGTISRKVVGQTVQYTFGDGAVSSVSSPTPCVFELKRRLWTDAATYDFNKLSRFEMETSKHGSITLASLILVGNKFMCFAGKCDDNYPAVLTSWDISKSFNSQRAIFTKYQHAIELIKHQCPGEPH